MISGRAGYFPWRIVHIPTVLCGDYAWLQVRAWDARLGTTYEEVLSLGLGGYGESKTFGGDGANWCVPDPELPTVLDGLESFSLRAVIPEPSPALLLLLGLPLPLLRRRR